MPALIKSGPGLLAPETVKIGRPDYGLEVETSEGTYYFEVRAGYCHKPLIVLEKRIEPGTKVKFKLDRNRNVVRFYEDRLGFVRSDKITVLEDQ